MAILFGIIVIALLVLILATLLGGEEGFATALAAGLGCAGVSLLVVVEIALFVVIVVVALLWN